MNAIRAIVLTLFALGCCVMGSPNQAAAQEKQPKEEAKADNLAKVTLTLDTGGHTHDIKKVVYTPDGKHIITGSSDGAMRIWDVETGRTLRVLYAPERRSGLFALSPN